MKLTVYMPALNEEENIKEVIDELPKTVPGFDEVVVMVVNDGSSDRTAEIAEDAGAIVISHSTNRGVGTAFQSAVSKALELKADVLVSIDADRQFDSRQIIDVVTPIIKGSTDMVTGNRFEKGIPENMPPAKYWGNSQMSKLVSFITGQKFRDVSCGFRAYNREALLRLNLFGSFTYTQETILDIVNKGLTVIEVPVKVKYFKSRRSRVAGNVIRYALRTCSIIMRTLRDYRPMVFFGGIGTAFLLIGAVLEGFLLVHFISSGNLSPYKYVGFTGLGLLIFGLLLVVLGVATDMLNRLRINQERILYEQKKRYYD